MCSSDLPVVGTFRRPDSFFITNKAPFLPAGQPGQVHGIAVCHVSFKEGLEVEVFTDETDARFPTSNHFLHQAVDAGIFPWAAS